MSRILLAVLFLASSLAAQRDEPAPVDAPYNTVFDPWHACMAAEDLAKRGAPDALRTIFLAIYVRANQPFLGDEGNETMVNVVRHVLAAIGDQGFATALGKQRPEIRGVLNRFADLPRQNSNSIPARARFFAMLHELIGRLTKRIAMIDERPNQSMKPTAPPRNPFNVFATTPLP
jgi:hypothetical protein